MDICNSKARYNLQHLVLSQDSENNSEHDVICVTGPGTDGKW